MFNLNNTPLCLMETNKININICKDCDIYLNVPFNLKE
jgi:hypothetical protein